MNELTSPEAQPSQVHNKLPTNTLNVLQAINSQMSQMELFEQNVVHCKAGSCRLVARADEVCVYLRILFILQFRLLSPKNVFLLCERETKPDRIILAFCTNLWKVIPLKNSRYVGKRSSFKKTSLYLQLIRKISHTIALRGIDSGILLWIRKFKLFPRDAKVSSIMCFHAAFHIPFPTLIHLYIISDT